MLWTAAGTGVQKGPWLVYPHQLLTSHTLTPILSADAHSSGRWRVSASKRPVVPVAISGPCASGSASAEGSRN